MNFFVKPDSRTEEIIFDKKNSKCCICVQSTRATEAIMPAQKNLANIFFGWFENVDLVQWNSDTKRVAALDQLKIGFSASLLKLIPFLSESKPDLFILMTDGVCADLKFFENNLLESRLHCPVILCFTLKKFCDDEEKLTSQIDTPLVKMCCKNFQHVAVVIHFADHETPILFNGTGIFDLETIIMPKSSTVKNCFDFVFPHLFPPNEKNINITSPTCKFIWINEKQLPLDLQKFNEFQDRFIDPEAVFDLSELDQTNLTFVLRKLYNWMYLSNFDQEKMFDFLHGFQKAMERYENGEEIAKKEMIIFKLKMQIALEEQNYMALEKKSLIELENSCEKETKSVGQEKVVAQLELLRKKLLQVSKECKDLLAEKKCKSILRESVVRLQQLICQKSQFYCVQELNQKNIYFESLNFDSCIRGECPFLGTEEFLGVFLQLPSNIGKIIEKIDVQDDGTNIKLEKFYVSEKKGKLISLINSKLYLNNPLYIDNDWLQITTPGVISAEFAKDFQGYHPITEKPVIGFVPLSLDVKVFCENFCSLLSRGLSFHILPLYVALLAKNMHENKWTHKIVVQHARFLLNNVLVRCRFLKSASETRKQQERQKNFQKLSFGARKRLLAAKRFVPTLNSTLPVDPEEGVSLYESIEYQLTHYRECLCQVSWQESMSMIRIATQLMPEFEFPVEKVRAYIDVINLLRVIRTKYVSKREKIVDFCISEKATVVYKMMAYMCFCDYFLNKSVLRCKKFQPFVVAAFELPLFGPILKDLSDNVDVPKEKMQDLCLKVMPTPLYIDFCSKIYKEQFEENLQSGLQGKPYTSNFLFEKIDVIAACCRIVSSKKPITFAFLLKRLQEKHGVENPAIYSQIIQQQIWIATSFQHSTIANCEKNTNVESKSKKARKEKRKERKRLAILKAKK